MSGVAKLQQAMLRQGSINQLDLHFAQWAASCARQHQEAVAMAACLLSRKVSEGHVCIDLKQYEGQVIQVDQASWQAPGIKDWTQQLQQSQIVSADEAPLILDKDKLYLYRHWRDECRVAEGIQQLRQQLDTATTVAVEIADGSQGNAVKQALQKGICLISGGPGTGKTTTMAHILRLLRQQNPSETIKLAAPTGRAVAGMKKAIADQQQQAEAYTLHRLLQIKPGKASASYATPVDADVLIVDEASMISLELMARLLMSIRQGTRLILIGDRHQLNSVEAGSVFSDICTQQETAYLTSNYRFGSDSGIGNLARAINTGNADQAVAILASNSQDITWVQDHSQLTQHLQQAADQMNCTTLEQLDNARVLAIMRQGGTGTEYINRHINQTTKAPKQVMVTSNSEQLKLYNGDIGIQTDDTTAFPDNRTIKTSILPSHEDAWAITVHKSQGSEFNHITLVTPLQPHPLMSRELLYTAITRARQHITIIATEQTIRHAIDTPIHRMSGLRDRLNPS